jgi:hypothetical protein
MPRKKKGKRRHGQPQEGHGARENPQLLQRVHGEPRKHVGVRVAVVHVAITLYSAGAWIKLWPMKKWDARHTGSSAATAYTPRSPPGEASMAASGVKRRRPVADGGAAMLPCCPANLKL